MNKKPEHAVKHWLIERILKGTESTLSAEEKMRLNLLQRRNAVRPLIYVGTGSCGVVAGALGTLLAIKRYVSENQIEAEIIETGCYGLCSAEPMVDVQLPGKRRLSFRNVTPEDVEQILPAILHHSLPEDKILGQYGSSNKEAWAGVPLLEHHPFFKLQLRTVTSNSGVIDPSSIEEYIARGGYRAFLKTITSYTPEKVCSIVEQSGLRGRGGRGFPTAAKWKIARDTPSEQKYVVCNADESDPGAFMNRSLIESNPHLFLEGVAIASYAVGATKAYIHIRKEYQRACARIETAIQQAIDYEMLGVNIHNSGVNLSMILRKGAGAFVCGEETALISSIEGKRGMPRFKPPFPAQTGLFGKPTVINNVETLANLPIIMTSGPQKYASVGTNTSKGTKMFAISGKSKYTGLVEVPMGTTLRTIVFEIGGGVKNTGSFKALHIGGPSGFSLPESMLELPVDYDEMKARGVMMGSGGITVLDQSNCIVDMVRYFTRFMHRESCGKCIPCREGTRKIVDVMDTVVRRPAKDEKHFTLERFKGVTQLEGLSEVMKSTSLCGLGKTAPNPVLGSLKWFRDEFEEHLLERKCRAAVCRDLRIFFINTEACTGCTVCAVKCPEQAIIGSGNNPHFIIEDKCTGCGICMDVCKFSAVFVK